MENTDRQSSVKLLEKALELRSAQEWSKRLGLGSKTIYAAKYRQQLSPALAWTLAEELGEDPAPWVMAAVVEGERDAKLKEKLAEFWRKR